MNNTPNLTNICKETSYSSIIYYANLIIDIVMNNISRDPVDNHLWIQFLSKDDDITFWNETWSHVTHKASNIINIMHNARKNKGLLAHTNEYWYSLGYKRIWFWIKKPHLVPFNFGKNHVKKWKTYFFKTLSMINQNPNHPILINSCIKYIEYYNKKYFQNRFVVTTNEWKYYAQDCAVCLEPVCEKNCACFAICEHNFCASCVNAIIKTNDKCPLCRMSSQSILYHKDMDHEMKIILGVV